MTFTITVDKDSDAKLLMTILQNLKLKLKIETEDTKDPGLKTVKDLKAVLKSVPDNMFSEIKDPVEWQRKLRDEWS